MSLDLSLFAQKSVFSFKRGQKVAQNKLQQRNKEQEIQEFANPNFNMQQYVGDIYTKQTPDKAPQHIDHLQHLLNNTNDLLKAYVYSNYTAFVHASNRTLSVENDIVFLSSLINNLKLSINTLPNETISIQSPNDQQAQKPITLFGLETPQDTFVLNDKKFSNRSSTTGETNLTGISGLYNRENLMRVQMFKQQNNTFGQDAMNNNNTISNNDDGLLDMPSIRDKYAKYIQNTTTAKWKDENGAVISSMNNITIPTNETINLVELAEDLQSLIFERRLSEAVNMVELFVILGVIPPILQFDQSIMDSITLERQRNKDSRGGNDDLSSLSIFSTKTKRSGQQNDDVNPKVHFTSLDYVDNGITDIQTSNPSHLRHRMVMSKAVLHENTANLVNPPLYFKPQTTTTAVHITNNIIHKNYYQTHLEDVNRTLLSSNDSNELTRARVYDNSVEISKYNDGQYTFQPILNLPVFPRPASPSSGQMGRPQSPKQATLDHASLIDLTPTPTTYASLYGFGKQPPPSTWRLQHQLESLANAGNIKALKKSKASTIINKNQQVAQNIITIRNNKVEKNSNITHHYTKQSKVSTYIGKLVTVLVSLLLDELGECVGTQWEQDQRMLLLCRLNQHHLALHRYLVLQSQITQDALKKTRYKGDLRIITQSICQIVYSNIQGTIRDFKRIFSSPNNNAPPTTSSTTSSSSTSTSTDGKTTTTTTSAVVQTMLPNNTYSYFRDDLVAHLSVWIVLEITHLGKLIDSQLLHQDDKFSNFPNCINAVHEAALETDYTLGTTTSNILVQCIHPSIVRTIQDIEKSIEKEINEYLSRDDWSPQTLNFTLVPISLQTPRDLLAKEALEMIDGNHQVIEYRAKLEEYQAIMNVNKRKAKKNKDKNGPTNITNDGDDKDDDDNNINKPIINSKGIELKDELTTKLTNMNEPKKPELPDGIDDVIHDKIRLHVSTFSIQIYKTLLTFARQLLSVVLCPIWHFSQESIVTVSVDVLCNCIDKVTRAIITLIRKHLQTLVAPLPPDFVEFVMAPTRTNNNNNQKIDQATTLAQDLSKKQDLIQKEHNLSSFLPSQGLKQDPNNPTGTNNVKSSLIYRTTALPTKEEKDETNQQIQHLAQTLVQTGTNGTTSKKEFKPLSETQLSVLLNSLSFIAHYAFPYLSLFMSVNLCKPLPELLNACYKQKKLTITAFEHVSKRKAAFLLRGRWFIQQELQYREKLEQQKLLIEKLIQSNNHNELRLHQDSIIPLPSYKEDQDNINTLHLPFNGTLFWVDSAEIHTRYQSLPEFPSQPSLKSISSHMFALLCHIYQQWDCYASVLTPHQSKYMLRLLIAEILDGLLDVKGWEVIFPNKNMALYMIADLKVLMYFSFALFGVFSESKEKLAALIRRVTRIYAKEYISTYEKEFKQARLAQKRMEKEKEKELLNKDKDNNNDKSSSDKNDSTSSTASSSSSSSLSTTTTSDGKTITKTTTTSTTTNNNDNSNNSSTGILNADLVDKPLKDTNTTTSSLLLNSVGKTPTITMDDLNNITFIEARNNEVELVPQYYKQVATMLVQHCTKTFTSKTFNCQTPR